MTARAEVDAAVDRAIHEALERQLNAILDALNDEQWEASFAQKDKNDFETTQFYRGQADAYGRAKVIASRAANKVRK
jgi:hypothetical protein